MSIKLEEILNLHTVYLSRKSSPKKESLGALISLLPQQWASRVAFTGSMWHGPWRKGGNRGTNLRAVILSITHDQLWKPGNKDAEQRGKKSGELTVGRETYPTASLCESCRSHTVLSIHGSNQISTVSLQVQTQADWKTNKNRLCIRIQGVRVSSWAPACYRCLSWGLWVYVA